MTPCDATAGGPGASSVHNALPATAAHAERRVAVVTGDRLCVMCGYNLTGQAVMREGHYDMLIVRCPECATVASVQEYPLLGRWANRWAAMLAALWFLFLVGLWVGSGAAIFGISDGVAEVGSETYGMLLTERWQKWQATIAPSGTQPSRVQFQPGTNDFTTWWKNQDRAATLREAGGRLGAVNWSDLAYFLLAVPVAPILGCVWATVLFSRRGASLVNWALAIMAVAGLFSAMLWLAWRADEDRMSWHGYMAALMALGGRLMIAALVFQAVLLALGMLIGRRVVRRLLRILLPPRMCGSLAFLWIADGLDPPRNRA